MSWYKHKYTTQRNVIESTHFHAYWVDIYIEIYIQYTLEKFDSRPIKF